MQTSGAKSEYNDTEIEPFLTFFDLSLSLSIINKFSDLH